MLESVFAKGKEISGANATMLLGEDERGSGGQMKASDKAITVDGKTGIFLPYRPNAINYVVPQGKDVVSSRFTGCYMAKYKVNGELRVAHVATPDCNEAWSALKSQQGVEVVAEFKPSDHVDLGSLGSGGGPQFLGVMTTEGYCSAVAAQRTGAANTGDTKLTVTAQTLVKAN
ncbi:MAG: hypothetical protein AAF802_01570 [Planctomycetota bacterium]